jgi:hypothetical protein
MKKKYITLTLGHNTKAHPPFGIPRFKNKGEGDKVRLRLPV